MYVLACCTFIVFAPQFQCVKYNNGYHPNLFKEYVVDV